MQTKIDVQINHEVGTVRITTQDGLELPVMIVVPIVAIKGMMIEIMKHEMKSGNVRQSALATGFGIPVPLPEGIKDPNGGQ